MCHIIFVNDTVDLLMQIVGQTKHLTFQENLRQQNRSTAALDNFTNYLLILCQLCGNKVWKQVQIGSLTNSRKRSTTALTTNPVYGGPGRVPHGILRVFINIEHIIRRINFPAF
jgi:hypothetical protein